MAASVKTIHATVSADGIVTTKEPIWGPCEAVITLLVEEKVPNAVTRAAMDEPIENLPRYTAAEAKTALGLCCEKSFLRNVSKRTLKKSKEPDVT